MLKNNSVTEINLKMQNSVKFVDDLEENNK